MSEHRLDATLMYISNVYKNMEARLAQSNQLLGDLLTAHDVLKGQYGALNIECEVLKRNAKASETKDNDVKHICKICGAVSPVFEKHTCPVVP